MIGGKSTLFGTAANVVSAGNCAINGKPVTFAAFLRYGVPIALCPLAMAALYVPVLFRP